MSEYQYYEFLAVDRPLTKAEQERLRGLSTRARITATSFTNHYEWGDFKGDPKRLVESCFDLHLYLANWGTRQLMMRVPRHLIDRRRLGPYLNKVDWVRLWDSGENTILDICRDEVEAAQDAWDDGTGWLAALSPLRADVLAGDMRLFYLLWLSAVADGLVPDDCSEPQAGIGPLTGALEAAVEYFDIDRDLAAAATASSYEEESSPERLRSFVALLSEEEKTDLLVRLAEGDTRVGAALRRRLPAQHADDGRPHRTAGELRAQAEAIGHARERAEAERQRAEQRRLAEEAEGARRTRLNALKSRGAEVWAEIEIEIERRNASGYAHAAALLTDLKQIAAEEHTATEFSNRLAAIRERHARKGQFLKRLQGL